MTVWAVQWSEIIENAKQELRLVREHLHLKSEELSVSDYLKDNFPNILDELSDRSGAKVPAI
jgi:hypothetical protein